MPVSFLSPVFSSSHNINWSILPLQVLRCAHSPLKTTEALAVWDGALTRTSDTSVFGIGFLSVGGGNHAHEEHGRQENGANIERRHPGRDGAPRWAALVS